MIDMIEKVDLSTLDTDCISEQAEAVLGDAEEHGRRGDDRAYNFYKARLLRLNLLPDQFETAIKKLCEILGY